MRIAVTGIGIVSAAGIGKEQTLATLRASRSGLVAAPSHFRTRHALPVGEVAPNNEELARRLGIRHCTSRTALLGIVAASEALADAAVAEGMPRAQAYTFAEQAVLGTAKYLLETGTHPAVLKDMVSSPAGMAASRAPKPASARACSARARS